MMDADGKIDPTFFSTCRLCVSTPGSYQILPQIQLQIKVLFDIKVDAYDGLPQLLCNDCRGIVTKLHLIRCDYQKKQQELVLRSKDLCAPEDPEENTENRVIQQNTVSPMTETKTSDTEIDTPTVIDDAADVKNVPNADAEIEIIISSSDESSRDHIDAEAQSEKWQEAYNCRFCTDKFSWQQIQPHLETHRDLIALQTQHKIKHSFVRLNRVGEGGSDASYVRLTQGTRVTNAFGNYFPSSHLNNSKIKKFQKKYNRIRPLSTSSSDEPVIEETVPEGTSGENNEIKIDANEVELKIPEHIKVKSKPETNQLVTEIDPSQRVLPKEKNTIIDVIRNIFKQHSSDKPAKRDNKLRISRNDTTFISFLENGPITLEWTNSIKYNSYKLQIVQTKKKDPNWGFKKCNQVQKTSMVTELEESLLKPQLQKPLQDSPSPDVITLSDNEENTAKIVTKDAPIIVVTAPLLPPSVIISTGCNQQWLQPQLQQPQPPQPPQPTPQPGQQFSQQSHPQQSLLVIQSQQPQQLIQPLQSQQLPQYQLIQPSQPQQVPDQSFQAINILPSAQQPQQLKYQPLQQIPQCSQPSLQQYQPQVQSQPQQPRRQRKQQMQQYSQPLLQRSHQQQPLQSLQQPQFRHQPQQPLQPQQIQPQYLQPSQRQNQPQPLQSLQQPHFQHQPQQPPQPEQIQTQYLQPSQQQYQPQTQVQLQQSQPEIQHQSFQQIQECQPQPLTHRSTIHYKAQPLLHQSPQPQFSPSQQQSLQSVEQLQQFQSPPQYPFNPFNRLSSQQQSQQFRQPQSHVQPKQQHSQQQKPRLPRLRPALQQDYAQQQPPQLQHPQAMPQRQLYQQSSKKMQPSSSGIQLIKNMVTHMPPARPVLKCKPTSALLSNINQGVEQTQPGIKPFDMLVGKLRAEGLILIEDNSNDSLLNLRALSRYTLQLGCQILWISFYVVENRCIFCILASDDCGTIAIRQESAANQTQIFKSLLSYAEEIEINAKALSGVLLSAVVRFLTISRLMFEGHSVTVVPSMPTNIEPSNLPSINEINS